MKRREFLLAVPAAALVARMDAQSSENDVILRAMREEMTRSVRPLSVVGGQPIYYIECALDDARSFSASASLGAVFNARASAFRVPRVDLRLGDKKFDNSNYIFSKLFRGTRFDPEQFPLDNNLGALRQMFWLAIDREYKTAIEALSNKRAALRNITQAEELPDYSDLEKPTKLLLPVENWKCDEEKWKGRIAKLSKIFADYPEVHTSSVDFDSSIDTYYYTNTEGTETRTSELMAYVRVRANGQAPDGMRVRDHETFFALEESKLASESEMEKGVRAVAENVRALVKAPPGDTYAGPVLFEAEAAAQLFADLIGGQATTFRKPVAEPGRPMNLPAGELEGRLNSRILPSSFTIVDDPTQKEYKGKLLVGHYPVDLEGVPAQAVTLIEKGTLKSYLATRTPTRDTAKSNGHARLPGSFGGYVANMSNLFVRTDEGIAPTELKKKFIEMLQQRNKPYGMLIRKMDFPSTASIEELRQMLGGLGARPAALPLLAYRVYPDGREELVRGLRFRALNARALKDIVAAGSDEAHVNFIGNGAPFSIVGGGTYVFGCSVVAPSILFEDLELERPAIEFPKLPVVSAP